MTHNDADDRASHQPSVEVKLAADRPLYVVGAGENAESLCEALVQRPRRPRPNELADGVPPAPQGLTGAPREEANRPLAYLSWRPVAAAARYRIMRDEGPLALTDDDRTSYDDGYVARGGSYSYRVAAVAASGAAGPPS